LSFSKKYLLLVEIPVFCSNVEILDYRELSIIFATKTDNSITPKMAKLSIIDNDNFRYIYYIALDTSTLIPGWKTEAHLYGEDLMRNSWTGNHPPTWWICPHQAHHTVTTPTMDLAPHHTAAMPPTMDIIVDITVVGQTLHRHTCIIRLKLHMAMGRDREVEACHDRHLEWTIGK
jgi:hypothetical protein